MFCLGWASTASVLILHRRLVALNMCTHHFFGYYVDALRTLVDLGLDPQHIANDALMAQRAAAMP